MKSLLSSKIVLVLICLNAIALVGIGVHQALANRAKSEQRRLAALRGAAGLERIGAIRASDHLRLSEISLAAERSGEIEDQDFQYICNLATQGPPTPGTKQASTFYVDLLFTLSRPKRYSARQRERIVTIIGPLITPSPEDRSLVVPEMAAMLAQRVGDRSLVEPLMVLQKNASGRAKLAAGEALGKINP